MQASIKPRGALGGQNYVVSSTTRLRQGLIGRVQPATGALRFVICAAQEKQDVVTGISFQPFKEVLAAALPRALGVGMKLGLFAWAVPLLALLLPSAAPKQPKAIRSLPDSPHSFT
jgi:hypothetical protein